MREPPRPTSEPRSPAKMESRRMVITSTMMERAQTASPGHGVKPCPVPLPVTTPEVLLALEARPEISVPDPGGQIARRGSAHDAEDQDCQRDAQVAGDEFLDHRGRVVSHHTRCGGTQREGRDESPRLCLGVPDPQQRSVGVYLEPEENREEEAEWRE